NRGHCPPVWGGGLPERFLGRGEPQAVTKILLYRLKMKKALCLTVLISLLTVPIFAGLDITRSNGISLTGADGINFIDTNGISLTGADGILAYRSNGISLTGADGISLTGADGISLTGAD